jgi:hypothetical protein
MNGLMSARCVLGKRVCLIDVLLSDGRHSILFARERRVQGELSWYDWINQSRWIEVK